ncbi:MAG: hypothetical protein AB4426_12060 [Xenococcaceae cyanobacterium]
MSLVEIDTQRVKALSLDIAKKSPASTPRHKFVTSLSGEAGGAGEAEGAGEAGGAGELSRVCF